LTEEIKGTARGEVEARLLDLSLSGALLHLTNALPENGIHDFLLNLDGDKVWVQAEVLRCRSAERGGFQVAVEFVGIAPEHRRTLEQYLTRRQYRTD
jgi:c-di-GMP-binding flagellar brake protein YcgR